MGRARINDEEGDGLPGEDSFLDIVANIVGILIILVMVVGVRASQGAFTDADSSLPESDVEKIATADDSVESGDRAALDAEVEALAGAQQEYQDRMQALVSLATEARIAEAERQRLLTIQAIQQDDLDQRRAKLSETEQREYDVQKQLVEAKLKHSELTREHIRLVSLDDNVEEIECLPTPIATTVDGAAIHVRLREGLLAVVPLDALRNEFQSGRLGYFRDGVRVRDEVADVVGPIDGFRLRLRVERYRETPVGASPLMAAHTTRVEMVQTLTVLPVAKRLGVVPEQALRSDAPLMRRIRELRSTKVAVVAWVYPDSYNQLRDLKQALWKEKVPLAVWPLGEDDEIIFSSHGTKAAAQ